MNNHHDRFDEWLGEIEADQNIKIDQNTKRRITDRVMAEIHKDCVQTESNPENSTILEHRFTKKKYMVPFKKVAIICCIIIGSLSISVIGYAAITEVIGVFKLTPQLEEQLDHENPVIPALTQPETLPLIPDKYVNSKILNEDSFDYPECYGPVTDVELQNDSGIYTISNIAFDTGNIAVLTKENGEAWNLEAGEQLSVTISIDTDFAASEESGEELGFSYVHDGKYYEDGIQLMTSTPSTYIFTAPEDGAYYPCVENITVTYIKIITLEVK